MAELDFPRCIYCNRDVRFIWGSDGVFTYYCSCGEMVEVVDLENGEGLLRDVGGGERS